MNNAAKGKKPLDWVAHAGKLRNRSMYNFNSPPKVQVVAAPSSPSLKQAAIQFELNQSNPERAPLLDWLSGIVLNLDDQDSLAVLRERFNVSIPCGSVDL